MQNHIHCHRFVGLLIARRKTQLRDQPRDGKKGAAIDLNCLFFRLRVAVWAISEYIQPGNSANTKCVKCAEACF